MNLIPPKIELTWEHKDLTEAKLKIIRANLLIEFPDMYIGISTNAEDQSKLSVRVETKNNFLTSHIIQNVSETLSTF